MNKDELEHLNEKFDEYKAEKLKDLALALQLEVKLYEDDITQQFSWDEDADREFNKERFAIFKTYLLTFPRFNRYLSTAGYPVFSQRNIREVDAKIFLSNSEYPENIYSKALNLFKSLLNVRNQESAKLSTPGLNYHDIRFRNNLTVIDPRYNYLYQVFDDSIFVYLLYGDDPPSLKEPVLELSIQDEDISDEDLQNANWPELPNGINQLKLEAFLNFNLLIAASDNSRIYFFDTEFIHDNVQKRICDPTIQKKLINEFTFKFHLNSSVWGIEILGEFGIILVTSNDKKVTSFQLFLDPLNNRITFGKRYFLKCQHNVPELKIINKHTMRLLKIENIEGCNDDPYYNLPVSSFQLLTGNIKGKAVKLEHVFSLQVLPMLNFNNIKEHLANALVKDMIEPCEEKAFTLKLFPIERKENLIKQTKNLKERIATSVIDKVEEQFCSQEDVKYRMGFNIINVTKFKYPIWGFHEISRRDFVKIDENYGTKIITEKFLECTKRIDSSLGWINRDIFKERDQELVEKLVGISDFPSISMIPIQELSISIITMLTYLCKLKARESRNIPPLEPRPLSDENYIIASMDRAHALMNSELIVNSFGVCMGFMLFIFSRFIPELCCHIRIDVTGLIYITRFYTVKNKFLCSRLYKIINLYEQIAEFHNENVIFDPGYIVGFDIKKIQCTNDLMKFAIYVVDNRQSCFIIDISEDMFTDTYLDFDF